MGKFKLTKNEFFKFLNNSTYVSNINTGQIIPPNMYNSQEFVKPIADSSKIVYNSNSNFIADNTKPQSNYINIKNIKL
jgi:hypothetical protein|tara:strand:- start:2695 stop:2928 length:234 start_codon:yes stop_codon:yes gene_type:complete